MSFDAHQNFALSTVLTPPSPAASGTSLTVAAGEGANFLTVPFNCTVWPADAQATIANAEIVRVTAVVGDVLTITRTREGTSARTIIAGDQIAETVTAKTFTDIEAAVEIVSNAVSVETSARGAAVNTVSNALSVETVARAAKDESLSAAVDVVGAAATSADNHANTVSAAVDIVSNAVSAAGILKQDVSVTLGSAGFDIKVNPVAVFPGLLAFNVFNAGFGHELLVIRTEQTAADLVSLASVAGGTFDETGYDVRVDTGSLAHLVSARANVVLEAGHYVLVCNEPGHTHLGMALDWTVKDLVSIHDRVNTLSAMASVADAHASAASAAAIANDASVSAAIMADVASHLASTSIALKADLTSVSAVIKADITSVSAVVKADAVSADTALSAVIKADALSADRAMSLVLKADIASVSAVITTSINTVSDLLSKTISAYQGASTVGSIAALSLAIVNDASASAAIKADALSADRAMSIVIKADVASVSAAIKTDAASMDTALSAVIKTDVVSAINVLSNLASNWVSAAFNASTATSSPAISNAASNAASANTALSATIKADAVSADTALSTVIKADIASVSAAIKTDTASMDTALSAVIANVSSRTAIGGATSTRGIQSAINNLSNNDSVMKSAYAGASTVGSIAALSLAISNDASVSAVIKADALSADRVMSVSIKADAASMDTVLSGVVKADAVSADTALSALIVANYGAGQFHVVTTGQALNANTQTKITGLSVSLVASGYYEIHGQIVWSQSSPTSASAIFVFGMSASAQPIMAVFKCEGNQGIVSASTTLSVANTLIQFTGASAISAATTSAMYAVRVSAVSNAAVAGIMFFDGQLQCSTAQTQMKCWFNCSSGNFGVTIQPGSWIRAYKIG